MPEEWKLAYEKLCESYQAIDDFRAKLLALLPIASGGGIFVLLNKDAESTLAKFSGPIGLFGMLVTVGLLAYELYGIRKCHAVILTAQEVESRLGMTGPFTARPRALQGFINEPFAAGIVYPAVMAAWAFIGLYFYAPYGSCWAAVIIFAAGFAGMLAYNLYAKHDAENQQPLKSLSKRMLKAEEAGNWKAPEGNADPKLSIRRADGSEASREFLRNRQFSADQFKVEAGWCKATVEFRITTILGPDGNPAAGQFHNTQKFVRQDGHWRCTDWQVTELDDD